jgi:hypothetical protein
VVRPKIDSALAESSLGFQQSFQKLITESPFSPQLTSKSCISFVMQDRSSLKLDFGFLTAQSKLGLKSATREKSRGEN